MKGLGRTKDDIVKDTVRELFAAHNFEDVLVKAHQVSLQLGIGLCTIIVWNCVK